MYSMECKDMGMDCSFKTSGDTIEEVKQKAMAHAQAVHMDVLATITPEQLVDMDKLLTSVIK